MKVHPQKNTLLQAAQSNAETKACKRVFFSPSQEEFFPPLFFLFFFSLRTGAVYNLTGCVSKINRYRQVTANLTRHHFGRTEARTDNKGFKEMAGEVLNQTVVLLIKCSGRLTVCASKPPLLKPPKRYKQA